MGRKKHKRRRKMGRLRAAWYVLNGTAQTSEQISAEWAGIQAQAAETFNRFNALAARLIRAEKNLLDRQLQVMQQAETPAEPEETSSAQAAAIHKAQLRARAAAARRGERFPVREVVPNVNGD